MTAGAEAARLEVAPFEPADADAWDALVARSPLGHFLHTRRFLSYHGERFRDASLVVRNRRSTVVAVLPAAVDPGDPSIVSSHPGATFGGVVHDGSLKGALAVDALALIRDRYAADGFRSLSYKPVPWIYHRNPCDDDLFALRQLGASCSRTNLSCAVDLTSPPRRSERRRRALKRALAAGVTLAEGPERIDELWAVLRENLERRYGSSPVHDEEEIRLLHGRFPDQIVFRIALVGANAVAGVVLFLNHPVAHAQYIAATEAGYEANALDAVFDHCLAEAAEAGFRYFDFGTSNERDGSLNATLFEYKSGFGGGGVAYPLYELALAAPASA